MTKLGCAVPCIVVHSQTLESVVSAYVINEVADPSGKKRATIDSHIKEEMENTFCEFNPPEHYVQNTDCVQRSIQDMGSTSKGMECNDEPRTTDAVKSPGTCDTNGENRPSRRRVSI